MTSTQQSTLSGLIIVPSQDVNPRSQNQSVKPTALPLTSRAQPIEVTGENAIGALLRRGTADYPAGRKINPEKRNIITWPICNTRPSSN
jgi:predicted transcriptional regulator